MEEVVDQHQHQHQQVLRVLQLLKQASHDVQSNPTSKPAGPNNTNIKALLELETESDTILSDPNLTRLSNHLSYLKTLVDTLHRTPAHGLRSFLRRRVSCHQIARVAGDIEFELQAWIVRESVTSLLDSIHSDSPELTQLLTQFTHRVSQGFDRELQDLVLKAGIFTELETILFDPDRKTELREQAALAIDGLIKFNKNVFVGQVVMGKTIQALIKMGSQSSIRVLCSLIKSIKSPLVDEIESNKGIPTIIGFLSSTNLVTRVLGLDCVVEIGYYGRKEAVEAMLEEGVVERLVELQRSELGGDLIDVGKCEEDDDEEETREEIKEGNNNKKMSREKYMEKHPFASCVARFAVQLEVGEGLRQREKRAFKQEILRRVREASVSDAEAATIQAEVLWGASP